MSDYLDNIASADNVVPAALQGNAVNFNGVDQCFTRDNALTAPLENVSVLVAFLPTDLSQDNGTGRTVLSFGKYSNSPTLSGRDYYRLIRSASMQYVKNNTVYNTYDPSVLAPYITVSVLKASNFRHFIDGRLIVEDSTVPLANPPFDFFNIACVYDAIEVPRVPRGYFKGSIKKVEIINGLLSASQARKASNLGTMEGIAAPSDFHVNLDGDNYDPATGIWTDTSPNGYVFNAQGATNPTQSTFI